MSKKRIIQSIFSWVVLFVFTISILPKSYFHDALAGHTDTLVTCDSKEGTQECVHPEGFDCRFDDLVVSALYVPAIASFSFTKPEIYPSFSNQYISFVLQQPHSSAVSRGPPTVVA